MDVVQIPSASRWNNPPEHQMLPGMHVSTNTIQTPNTIPGVDVSTHKHHRHDALRAIAGDLRAIVHDKQERSKPCTRRTAGARSK